MQENDNSESTPAPSTKSGASTGLTILAIILLVLSVGAVVAAAYYSNALNNANNTNSDLSSQLSKMKAGYTSANATIVTLNGQIATLNGQISTLNSRVANDTVWIHQLQTELSGNVTLVADLRSQIVTLNNEITALNGEVSTLQTQLTDLERPRVIAVFQYTLTPCTFVLGSCWLAGAGTLTDVAFTNLGTTPANNVQITVRFYDTFGNRICSVTQTLAMTLSGGSIGAYTDLANSCAVWVNNPQASRTSSTITWS